MYSRSKFKPQILAAIPVALGELIAGLGYGWLSPTLKNANIHYGKHVSSIEESWIGSLHSFGRVLGPLLSLYFLDKIGRSWLLITFLISTSFIWLLLFAKYIEMIYVARILFGIACGVFEMSNAIYLAENCSSKLRLFISSFTSSFFYCGMLFEFILATYCGYDAVLWVNCGIGIVSMLSLKLLKEPAQFLIARGKYKKALKSIMYLKAIEDVKEAEAEMERMKNTVEEESHSDVQRSKKLIIVTMILHALTPWTGYETLTAFASMTFYSYNLMSENQFVILLGLVQFLISCSTMQIVNASRRRTFIMTAFVICTILHTTTATLFYLEEYKCDVPYAPWLVFCSVTIYMGVYSAVYPAIYILRGELFPIHLKARGGCVCIMANGSMEFLTTSIYLGIIKHIGNHFNFLLYSIFSAVTVIYVYYFIPETKVRTKNIKKGIPEVETAAAVSEESISESLSASTITETSSSSCSD
ncbi:facilitated trehalose transporter Tret1-like [Planococcus citri]|uniref:facilitated trehalose transporter Tret1-like n=1 Tax=Planococcus citri TaxID=170843 RepID=UPI0031F8ECAA